MTDPVHPRRWLILPVLCLSVFLVVVDNTIVNVALPTLSAELEASTSQLQWIVDAYSLVFAGLLLAAGSLGDRVGRKGTMQVGLVLFALTSVVASAAGTAGELIVARGVMGIAAALVFQRVDLEAGTGKIIRRARSKFTGVIQCATVNG